jgi:hypothetical protein
MEEKLKLNDEIAILQNLAKKNILEINTINSFFKTFRSLFEEQINSLNNKLNDFNLDNNNSILSVYLNNIIEYFKKFNNEYKNIILKIQNELINSVESFKTNQVSIYKENNDELNEIILYYNNNQKILNNSIFNYYKSYYNAQEEEKNQIKKRKGNFNSINVSEDESDLIIKDKMEAKNNEVIYKFDIEKYNKELDKIIDKYLKIKLKIETAEKGRISFIKASFDKQKSVFKNISNLINNYIDNKENFSDEISKNIEQEKINEISKLSENIKKSIKLKTKKFVSAELIFRKQENYNLFIKNCIFDINVMIEKSMENNQFYNKLIDELISDDDVPKEKISRLIEIFQYQKDNENNEKDFLDALVGKNKSSLKFQNLKNLELLAIPLSYISLKHNSIFSGNFEINFQIIFIAERFFYQNKVNNNKVYLSAILSKNKFYKTKLFWQNVIELKLVKKLEDDISRLKNVSAPNEKKKGILGILGNKMGLNNNKNTSFLLKMRIMPLIKNYTSLEQNKLILLDRMAINEMYLILKKTIENFSNFNFPSIQSLDLISNISREYKLSNEQINYLVIYYKVSNHTIRKLLPHEKNKENNNIIDEQISNEKIRNIKILSNCIQFLDYKDYNNLLLTSKYYNQKLKKKIYKYILRQDKTSIKTRLQIWSNILKIKELKKKYNYKEILNNTNDPKIKHEIDLDVRRTNVEEGQKDLHKLNITNILYAVSSINFGVKYVQGMNCIVAFLYELFGEEDAFYIFLSFFHSTQYILVFDKNLTKLNEFFYVFNRIISLSEPELSSWFNINGVNVNFFATPWFITLFTGSHQNLRGDKDNKKLLIRILDNFITSGWKSMMVVGCSLLHSFEQKLMNMKYEDMLELLINGMLKSEFFMKENKNNLENYFINVKINKDLIRNIEAEYNFEKMLNDKNYIKNKNK